MKYIKYLFTLSLVIFINLTNTCTTFAAGAAALNQSYISDLTDEAMNWPEAPEIIGEAAIVMEATTGTILYNKNMNEAMYPASVTKLVTALLVLENCKLDEMVLFSNNAVFSIPRNSSHIAINPGETLSVEHCLYGLLLASANEVANALAEHVSGTTEEFSKLMTSRMEELGAINTHFANANGLHDDNHYTTCYDIATLCRTLIQNRAFLEINKTASYVIPPTNLQPLKRPINTTHKLIRSGSQHYDGCFGGKTGHTDIAGNTLVTFAERNGMTLISVVMKSDATHIYSDTTSLLDYGFSHFKKVDISKEESSFNFLEDSLSTDTDFFHNPNPSLVLANNDYVYLPANVNFSDLEYTLIAKNSDTVFADIVYTYKGHFVGKTTLNTIKNTDNVISSDIIRTEDIPEDNITIQIRPIHFIIIGIVIIIIILCIVYLKVTEVERMRKRAIRRRNHMQRKRNKLL